MKVSTENDNNFGYEKITIVVDNMPLRREVIARSVDISRIVDHHCLNFLFIIVSKYKIYLCKFSK
jgi:hypothetical protein